MKKRNLSRHVSLLLLVLTLFGLLMLSGCSVESTPMVWADAATNEAVELQEGQTVQTEAETNKTFLLD